MNILLRQAKIVDPQSPFHNQTADILVQNGIITSIGQPVENGFDQEIKVEGLCVSPGWVDLFAHFCDPGFEHRETLESGAAAAAAGGFTQVLLVPNTTPFTHNKSGVEYIIQKSKHLPVQLTPIGAITKNGEGKELAEMYDMYNAGAAAFSDGWKPVQSAGLLLKALQYLKAIDATVIQLPDDNTINPNGLMHEGIVSTRLGLPGKPAIAEELAIARDIELVKYTGSKIHFTGVTTAKSIELIAKAKQEGLPVTCSVAPYHLLFTDEDLKDYNTNLKVTPPLRTAADREALRNAVLNGVVDCIASHHQPRNVDEKLVEFEYAKDGMLELQTSFAIVNTVLPQLTEERLVQLFSTNAQQIFGLQQATINEKETARLTLFKRTGDWALQPKTNLSLSANTPFFNYSLKGKPLGIINKDKVFLNQD